MIKITKVLLCALLLNAGLWAVAPSSSSREETEELAAAVAGLSLDDASCNSLKQTLLHRAAEQGNIQAIYQLVVEQGAPMNVGDWMGQTPLHYAAIRQYKRPEVFDLLIELGADRYACNNCGKLAWPERQMLSAAASGNLEVIQRLVDAGAELDVDDVFQNRNHVLHFLAASRNHEALRWACQVMRDSKKKSVDVENYDWVTPLHVAAYYKDKVAMEILISFGADKSKCARGASWENYWHYLGDEVTFADGAKVKGLLPPPTVILKGGKLSNMTADYHNGQVVQYGNGGGGDCALL
ncbi:ankyrin repeat domain-containing protein [Candidatus Babeliales bacterium]|nr:ankyrin repeat domain-containing protein [Candidatus Babeliales bacterium]